MASAQLIRDVILRDGSTLRLRTPSPADFDDIKAFYDALSPESRYLRFHGYGRTDTAARDYAEADGVDRMALIGHHSDRVVAAAGYDRLREPAVAEVAFAVAEDFHGSGTATRMLEQLAEIAAGRGIQRFDAEVMADNSAMLRVFKPAGFGLRRTGGFGEVVVSLDIRPTEAVKERIEERDRRAAVASLRPILAPRSIAVVGAFSEPGSLGAAVLANIVAGGFTGVAAPVSRSGGVVQSMRVAPSLGALDEAPELVVIAAPAAEVLDVASEAAQKGSRALMVLSAGFAEDGEEGRAREERLLEIVRSGGLRMVGPNCLGVRNTDPAVSLDATLARSGMREGRLAICSQSGAIGIGLLGHAEARGLGVSSFASLGNRADVSTNDLLELWEEDARRWSRPWSVPTATCRIQAPGACRTSSFPSLVRQCSPAQPNAATGSHVRWGSGRGTATSTRRRPALACQRGWSGSPVVMEIRATDGCRPRRPRRCSPRIASRS
jgi:acetate---CoA ligase (ADP-forming)